MIGPFNPLHFNPNHFATGHIPTGEAVLAGYKEEIIVPTYNPPIKGTIEVVLNGVVSKPYSLEVDLSGTVEKPFSLEGNLLVPVMVDGMIIGNYYKPMTIEGDISVEINPLENTELMKLINFLNSDYIQVFDYL